jgi:chorismate synthase
MDELRKAGDSVGARITTVAEHVPVGWGAPVYAKLDADLASAMMSINAVKAVEIGSGFASVTQRGSEHGDELTPEGFLTNHAGGILGGISSGQDIIVTIGIKPSYQFPASSFRQLPASSFQQLPVSSFRQLPAASLQFPAPAVSSFSSL